MQHRHKRAGNPTSASAKARTRPTDEQDAAGNAVLAERVRPAPLERSWLLDHGSPKEAPVQGPPAVDSTGDHDGAVGVRDGAGFAGAEGHLRASHDARGAEVGAEGRVGAWTRDDSADVGVGADGGVDAGAGRDGANVGARGRVGMWGDFQQSDDVGPVRKRSEQHVFVGAEGGGEAEVDRGGVGIGGGGFVGARAGGGDHLAITEDGEERAGAGGRVDGLVGVGAEGVLELHNDDGKLSGRIGGGGALGVGGYVEGSAELDARSAAEDSGAVDAARAAEEAAAAARAEAAARAAEEQQAAAERAEAEREAARKKTEDEKRAADEEARRVAASAGDAGQDALDGARSFF